MAKGRKSFSLMSSQIIIDDIVKRFELEKTSLNGAKDSEFYKLREKAHLSFLEKGFPTTKDEDWKYTNFSKLFRSLDQSKDIPSTIKETDLSNGLAISLKNGILDNKPKDLPKGLRVNFYTKDELYKELPAVVKEFLLSGANQKHDLERLNLADLPGILHIKVDRGISIEKPLFISRKNSGGELVNSRIILEMEENSSLKCAELNNENTKGAWSNNVVQVQMAKSSLMHHYKLQTEGEQKEVYLLAVQQGAESNFHSYAYSWSGGFVRNDIRSEHMGERCFTDYTGLYVLSGNEFSDFHTLIDHAKPNCNSSEIYKGIVTDKAKAVFNGRVMVREDAQKTNAYQSNRNILLSDNAQINTKPQLEIFADDVKCSHGATTGQIDENELFYLRSRGIDKEEARQMLLYAFAEELVQRISEPQIRMLVEHSLRAKLDYETGF